MLLLVTTGDGVVRLEGDVERMVGARTFDGPSTTCVAWAPGGERAFVGTQGHGLWRSGDGGRTWTDCELPAADVFSVAIGPVDDAVYAGCEPSSLFVSRDGGVSWRELDALRRIPSAPTWSFPPRPWTSHVRWIAPSPHDADVLLVGIELGGVMRTEDGGETWADHRPGAKLDAHALAWHPLARGRAYQAAGDGTAWSTDGGESWQPIEAGRDRGYVWALAVDPLDPDTWYVSAAPGPFAAHGSRPASAVLYRWRGSGPWEPAEGALAAPLDVMPYALVATASELWVGMRDGRLFVGEDFGDAWRSPAIEGDSPRRLVQLAAA